MNKQELQSLLEGVRTALTGNQSKLDKNQNNKIDREDFTLLRSKKKPMAENADLQGLLEHLYGVLLDEKAARLKEAQYDAGRTSYPSSFYQGNREDNDRIRMSIVRASAEENKKKKEKEEQERQRGAQMENAEYDSIFENIYNLLAESVPPGESPIYYEPLTVPNPDWDPNNWRSSPYLRDIDGNPLLQSPIFYKPLTPMPPMPTGPNGWFPPHGTNGESLSPRPDFPPCPGPGDCLWQWVHTVRWVWNTQGYWELLPIENEPPGSHRYGGHWKLEGDPLDVPFGHRGLDEYGRPGVRPRLEGWELLWRQITGQGRRPPIGYQNPIDAPLQEPWH